MEAQLAIMLNLSLAKCSIRKYPHIHFIFYMFTVIYLNRFKIEVLNV